MSEASDALGFFATSGGVSRFFVLLFPGFIALAVFDLRIPAERRKWSETGVSLVAYSVLIDVLVGIYLASYPLSSTETVRRIVVAVLADLIVPALVGWFAVDLREWLASSGFLLSAMPKAWDEFFYRFRSETVAIVVTLNDGTRIAGFWAENPFASSFPADEDLLISAAVRLGDDGIFVERIPNLKAVLLKRDDIKIIEAYDGKAMADASNAANKAKPEAGSQPGDTS